MNLKLKMSYMGILRIDFEKMIISQYQHPQAFHNAKCRVEKTKIKSESKNSLFEYC